MKNKHNTMNSSSSQKSYMNMLNKLVQNPNCQCFLVEVIARKSQNIPWEITLNGKKNKNEKIRRVSIDRFYEIVTGDKFAFYKLCELLPELIKKVINEIPEFSNDKKDTVIEELKLITTNNLINSLFTIAFETYYGWRE